MRIQEVIRRPLITEKSTQLRSDRNIVAFEVDVRANKVEIRKAVEQQFDVKVADVRVANVQGKLRRQGRYVGRKAAWKKAYVRLAEGEKSIEFFEGV
ncbi:MAG: 50S ribosomal protein L23 [Thermoanaerobaculia bacterium]